MRLIDADALRELIDGGYDVDFDELPETKQALMEMIDYQDTVDAVEVVRCRECKHWKQQTNYAGVPLSFGFCESDDMWRSLYGETYEVAHIDTEDDFYCGYAKRRE